MPESRPVHRSSAPRGHALRFAILWSGIWLWIWLAPTLLRAEDPSNLSTHDIMDEIVQDAVRENSTTAPGKKTEKSIPTISVTDMCARIGVKLRSVDPAWCQKFNLKPTGAHSVNGLPILLKE
ncbi:MAG: hypothetical protein HQL95_14830 [Magnetococcales bacterium]|nr:hypothetical protein [Magnetococcales bacterium]